MSDTDISSAMEALTNLAHLSDDELVQVAAGDLRRLIQVLLDAHVVELELGALRRILVDDAETLEPFFAMRRTDGELILGEYSWMHADTSAAGGFLWDAAEDSDDDEPVEWQVCKMFPVVIERRCYQYGRWLDDPDREPDEDDDV